MLLLKACKYYFGNSGLRGALTMPIPDKIENKKATGILLGYLP